MNKFRFVTGIATVALVVCLSSNTVVAQTTGGADGAQPAARAKATKTSQSAAERRRIRRQKRQERAAAARAAAATAAVSRRNTRDQIADQSGGPGDIVVTGTRIAGNYGRTGAPVQTLGKKELERRGLAHLEEAMNALPAVQPGLGNQTRNTNNDPASFGRSPINLRNLGGSRTLVLVNGQRAVNDTNNIPASMLERVEVLTGGASAVYGSDAVGGVVNYILKRNFTGITIDGEGSVFQHRNNNAEMRQLLSESRMKLPPKNFIGGPQGFINGSAGMSFDNGRGNVTAHAGYRVTTDLSRSSFDTTACWLANGPPNDAPPGAFNDRSQRFCVNTPTYNPYGVFGVRGIPEALPGGPDLGGPTEEGVFSNAYDGSRRFRMETSSDRVPTQFREFIYRSDTRFDWGLNARYMVDEASQSEINGTYSHTRFSTTSEDRNYDPVFADNVSINCDNPFLSAQQATTLCGTKAGDPNSSGTFNFIEYWPTDGKRVFKFLKNEQRVTAQFKGLITKDIRYETNVIYTRNLENSNFNSYYSGRRLANGLRARSVNGTIVCLTPIPAPVTQDIGQNQRNLADDAGCQPLDIFSAAGPNEAGKNYLIQNPGGFQNLYRELVVNGTISGSLGEYGIRSPFAQDAIGLSMNVEGRRVQTGQISSGAVYNRPVDYTFRELDLSGEIAVPLIQDVRFIKYLQASGAYRRMDFFGASGSTWRAGLDYRVSDELSFRSSYSTSYRVDPYQTFLPNTLDTGNGFPRFLDLCSPPGGTKPIVQRLTAEQCQVLGVTAQQYAALSNRTDCNEAGFCPGNVLNGGNRNLKPEQGVSVTVGLTINPKALKNLSFSADYYRNKISQFISYVDPYISFTQCRAGELFYCSRYNRDPATGRIDTVGYYADARATNFGWQINSGIDFNTDYRIVSSDIMKRNIGDFAFNFVGNLRLKNQQQKLPGSPVFDCTGYYGYGGRENCGSAANPRWRHTFRVIWALPWSNLALNGFWRYTGSNKYAGLQSNPVLSTPPTATDIIIPRRDAYLPASSFFDIGATMKAGKNTNLRLTVTNIFDTDPYLMVNNNGGWYNTQPLMYDVLGRKITLGFTATF